MLQKNMAYARIDSVSHSYWRRLLHIVTASDNASSTTIEVLYTSHHGWLQAWLHRKLGNSCDAADLAHDTFLRLIASQRVLNHEPRALITHIAKGLVIDLWRRRQVQQAYLETLAHLPEQQVPSPETGLIIVEALVAIDAMLRSLPTRTRELFLMAQLDGLTLSEIATRTGMPIITIRRHIQKALLTCMAVAR